MDMPDKIKLALGRVEDQVREFTLNPTNANRQDLAAARANLRIEINAYIQWSAAGALEVARLKEEAAREQASAE